jgi:type VI secretion system protein ImpG
MLPQRFSFVEFSGLQSALQRCVAISEIDLIISLSVNYARLANIVKRDNFALFCTPAINLFDKKLDRIQIKGRMSEQHAVLDRTRSMDFEVYRLAEVTGHGTGNQPPQKFLPFYAIHDIDKSKDHGAYYTVHRRPRLWSQKQRRTGLRSGDGYNDLGYIGNEIFVSLVDMNETPYRGDLQQLSFSALCTNRDLPLLWRKSIGQGKTDFTLELSAPVEAIRCLVQPTAPRPTEADGHIAWLLISQLSLNYLSLLDGGPDEGAIALRELLGLYCDRRDVSFQQQINGVKSVYAEHVTRRMPIAGPITFGRGLRIVFTMDDSALEGTGAYMLGAVLERFFAKYVSINSFTQTVVRTENRELRSWPVRTGLRHTL